jgi:hypothetical protein
LIIGYQIGSVLNVFFFQSSLGGLLKNNRYPFQAEALYIMVIREKFTLQLFIRHEVLLVLFILKFKEILLTHSTSISADTFNIILQFSVLLKYRLEG